MAQADPHPKPENTVLAVIDIQERLAAAMPNFAGLLGPIRRMIRAADALGVATIVTEQYPDGLGPTVPEVADCLPGTSARIEKTTFSCWGTPQFAESANRWSPRNVILVGMETHVCVEQTALDALTRGLRVFVPVDAVASRHDIDRETSLDRMMASGAVVTTVEAVVFALLRHSRHPAFRTISALFK